MLRSRSTGGDYVGCMCCKSVFLVFRFCFCCSLEKNYLIYFFLCYYLFLSKLRLKSHSGLKTTWVASFFFSCFLLLLRNMAKSKLSMYYMMFSDRDFVVW